MTILSDRWIRRMAADKGMIEPFVDGQKRQGVISYGLSSYGYDARVGPDGCELDSDGDRVVDRLDRCPGTVAGARVDANGCEVVTLKGVNFANNSAELNAEARAVLDQAAAGLARRGDIKVEVAGHTDNRGSAALNRDLSQRRAESVMRYLVSKGASASNLSARGYGPDSPVADNKTASGRAENRRVELRQLQ